MTTPRPAGLPAGEPDARSVLRDHGLRSTPQRVAVLSLLAEVASGDAHGHRHLTAAEIHQDLTATGRALDPATVYRTLTTLANLGLVHTSMHGPGTVTYGLAARRHHHAVCVACGTETEIPGRSLATTLDLVGELTGFEEATVTVHGRCPACAGATS